MQGGKNPKIYNSCTVPGADVQTDKNNNCFIYNVKPNCN